MAKKEDFEPFVNLIEGKITPGDLDVSKLQEDVYAHLLKAGGDKQAATQVISAFGLVKDNPYDPLFKAIQIQNNLNGLLNKKPDEMVKIEMGPGNVQRMRVDDPRVDVYKKHLDQLMQKAYQDSIALADSNAGSPEQKQFIDQAFNKVKDKIDNNKIEYDKLQKQEQTELVKKQEADLQKNTNDLIEVATTISSMRYATDITRAAYATYLMKMSGDAQGNLNEADVKNYALLANANFVNIKDPEVMLDPVYKHLDKQITDVLKIERPKQTGSEVTATTGADASTGVVALLKDAEGKVTSNPSAAEADFKNATILAAKQIEEIKAAEKEKANDPKELEKLKAQELQWTQGIAYITNTYAAFLKDQHRDADATALIENFKKTYPDVAGAAGAGDQAAQQVLKAIHDHMQAYEANISSNPAAAMKEVTAVKEIADELNMPQNQAIKQQVDEYLKSLIPKQTDDNGKQAAQNMLTQFDHLAAETRIDMAGLFAGDGQNNLANKALAEAHDLDAKYCDESKDYAKVLDDAKERSWFGKACHTIGNALTSEGAKNFYCHAAAITVAVGLTIGTEGVGVLGAGAAASATYTGMKLLFGQKVTWTTPIVGFTDGLAVGAVAKGMTLGVDLGLGFLGDGATASSALAASGADASAVTAGLGTVEGSTEALGLAKTGLSALGKDLTFTERFLSRIPFLNYGSAAAQDYAVAANATSKLNWALKGVNATKYFAGGLAGSAVSNAGSTIDDYATGRNRDVGSLAWNYAKGTFEGGLMAGAMGPMMGNIAGKAGSMVTGSADYIGSTTWGKLTGIFPELQPSVTNGASRMASVFPQELVKRAGTLTTGFSKALWTPEFNAAAGISYYATTPVRVAESKSLEKKDAFDLTQLQLADAKKAEETDSKKETNSAPVEPKAD